MESVLDQFMFVMDEKNALEEKTKRTVEVSNDNTCQNSSALFMLISLQIFVFHFKIFFL